MDSTPLSLLHRLRQGADEQSWARLFALYTPLIRHWVTRHGVFDSDADDLVQEVCVTVSRELSGFAHVGHAGAFRGWVRMIVLNRLRGYWRERRKAPATRGDLDQLEDPDSQLGGQWDRDHDEFVAGRLLELIQPEFSPATWRAFRIQVIEGVSAARAAEELGISVNAVLIAKSRVLRRLRQEGRGLIGSQH
jgi:RNA polymerase sigma-70 factor (ECF subfamily)